MAKIRLSDIAQAAGVSTASVSNALNHKSGINREKAEKYAPKLPAGTQNIVIEGGCHAFFGAYGNQKGDGVPSITREEQIRQTVQAILALLPKQ